MSNASVVVVFFFFFNTTGEPVSDLMVSQVSCPFRVKPNKKRQGEKSIKSTCSWASYGKGCLRMAGCPPWAGFGSNGTKNFHNREKGRLSKVEIQVLGAEELPR